MGAEARARLTLLGLIGVTLLAYVDLFAHPSFLGPALLAVLLSMGLAVLGRRFGLPTALLLGASAAALVWYLVLIFEPSATLYGLPTPAALRGLYGELRRAQAQTSVDYAPVPVRAGYVAAVSCALWIAGTVGEIATFRWRRPLVAVVPCIGLFGLVLVVGAGKATGFWVALFLVALTAYLAFEARHSLRFWGRWVTAWADRPADDADQGSGPVARRMAACCVVAALVAPLFLPQLAGVLQWRNLTGNGPGAGPGTGSGNGSGETLDPLVSIVPHLIRQSNRVLLRVQTNHPEYLRLETLTRFDGRSWLPPRQSAGPIADGRVTSGNPRPSPAHARRVAETITIDGLRGVRAPAVEQAVRAVTGPNAGTRTLFVANQSGDLIVPQGVDTGFTYETVSVTPRADMAALEKVQPRATDYPLEATLPHPLSPAVQRLLDRWTQGDKTAIDKLTSIQDHLRRFDYGFTEGTQPTEDYLTRFLTTTRRGYCQQFAAAFALLARALGYPARVVVGFLPGTRDRDGSYVVRGTDAHAWPEVFFRGFGWLPFEPTPRSDTAVATPPSYTLHGGSGSTASGAARNGRPGKRRSEEANLLRRRELRAAQAGDAARTHPGARHHPPSPWKAAFSRFAGILAALLAALVIALPLFKRARIRRRYARARDPSAVAAAAFAHCHDAAAALLGARRPSESATDFARRVAERLPVPEGPARRLAALHDAACYSPAGLDRVEGAEARSLARRLDAALWSSASAQGRLTLLFSPRGLVHGDGARPLPDTGRAAVGAPPAPRVAVTLSGRGAAAPVPAGVRPRSDGAPARNRNGRRCAGRPSRRPGRRLRPSPARTRAGLP